MVPELNENEVQTIATIVGTLMRDGWPDREAAVIGGKIFAELRARGLIREDDDAS